MKDRLAATAGMAALASWVSALVLGPLVTQLPPYAEPTWWLWPLLRVGWVLASALTLSAGMARGAPAAWRRFLLVGSVTLGVSLLLTVNPLLDLALGPWEGEGRVDGARIHRGRLYTRPASGATPSIDGRLEWVAADGRTVRIEPIGVQANRMEDALAACPGGAGRLFVLRHLDVFVSLDCAGGDSGASAPGPAR